MASKTSPYYKTGIIEDYLDLIRMPTIDKNVNDEYYTIESKYDRRPDLLAYELYGNTRLWWVFIKRNMNEIKDPINDFRTGLTIRIPSKQTLAGLLT